MRKRVNFISRGCKQNKYDQITNLGIDVESSMAKSIILPKIYNKIAQIEASELTRKYKERDQREMSQLKDEISKLRRHICLMDERKAIQRMKTEEVDERILNERTEHAKQSIHLANRAAHRHSIEASNMRIHRNSDKNTKRQENNASFFLDKSQISFVNSALKLEFKSEEPEVLTKKSMGSLSKIKPKEARVPNPRLRRKFRIAVYAVYFSLFLPVFAKKVYNNKLKQFMLEYPIQVSKYFKGKLAQETTANTLGDLTSKFKIEQSKLWNFFQDKLNLPDMVERSKLANCISKGGDVKLIKEHFQFLMNNQLDSSERDQKEMQTLEQQLSYPKNMEYLLQGFQGLITKITDTISAFITRSNFFTSKWKTFSLGIMNNAFVHNSHPKLPAKVIQSGIIRLHPFKEVLLVFNQETESLFLATDILCRIFSHRWMVRLEKLKGQSEQNEPVRLVCSYLVTILYIICEKMVDEHLETFKKESLEAPASVRARSKFIRPIVPLLVRGDKKRDDKLLKTNRLIANAPLEEQAAEAISSNPAFVLTVQTKIKNIGYLLYDKLSTKMREDLIATKQKTLNERILSEPTRVKNEKGQIQVRGEPSSSIDRKFK